MKTASILLLLAGLALLTGLVVWQGFNPITDTLALAGWQLLWLPAFHLIALWLGAEAWWILFQPGLAPGRRVAFCGNGVGASVNWVLPAAQIGGELVKARMVYKGGIAGDAAIASVVVDKTLQALSQPVFALLGVGLFALVYGDVDIIIAVIVCCVLLGGGIFGFYLVQRLGIFGGIAHIVERAGLWTLPQQLSEGAARTDDAIRETYGRRNRLLWSCLWRLAYRIALVGEIWLALKFFGHPVSLLEALILESLIQVVVAGAFFVPGAFGIQEGGFVLLGAAMGLPPEIALSVSLARRARELLIGVPTLVGWQIWEGRDMLVRRAAARLRPATSNAKSASVGPGSTAPL